MDENEFNIGAVVYIAIECGLGACDGCAFSFADCGCVSAPACVKERRKDGRDVIFVEKQQ